MAARHGTSVRQTRRRSKGSSIAPQRHASSLITPCFLKCTLKSSNFAFYVLYHGLLRQALARHPCFTSHAASMDCVCGVWLWCMQTCWCCGCKSSVQMLILLSEPAKQRASSPSSKPPPLYLGHDHAYLEFSWRSATVKSCNLLSWERNRKTSSSLAIGLQPSLFTAIANAASNRSSSKHFRLRESCG